jgi:hypothetical protein
MPRPSRSARGSSRTRPTGPRPRRGRHPTTKAPVGEPTPPGADSSEPMGQTASRIPFSALGSILDTLAPLIGPDPHADAGSIQPPPPAPEPSLAIDHWLMHFEARYLETKNPVFVWEAVGLAYDTARPFPAWVVAYLARVADRFQRLSRTQVPESDLPAAIARAVEFDRVRGQNPFHALTDTAHDLGIAFQVWSQVRRGDKLDAVLTDVAQRHPQHCTRNPKCTTLHRSTVARIWKRHQSIFPK